MGSVFILAIPVLIIFIIFIVSAARSEKTGGKDVIKKVYVYLVLFVTLMMIIGGSVAAFMAIADYITPTAYHQAFEDYSRWQAEPVPDFETGELKRTELSKEEIKENYDAMIKEEEERNKKWALNNLIKSFGWIIIPLPVFIYFQRKLKNENFDE